MFVAVANCRYFGGGMMVAPDADSQDGLLDFVVLSAISKSRLVRKIGLVYRGIHVDLPEVEVFRGSRLVADVCPDSGGDSVLLDVDGESLGNLPCEFTVSHRALRLAL